MRTVAGTRTVLKTGVTVGPVAVGTGASGTNIKGTNAIVTVGMGATAAHPTVDTVSGTSRPLAPPSWHNLVAGVHRNLVQVPMRAGLADSGGVVGDNAATGAIDLIGHVPSRNRTVRAARRHARQVAILSGFLEHAQLPRFKPRIKTGIIISSEVYRVARPVNHRRHIRQEAAP